jgi:hypothetical protein
MKFFAKRNKAAEPQPSRRSALGIMFNPDIGDSIRPLGQVISIFVQLIAMIFATNGLFPKDHPALSTKASGTPRLTLFEIFSTAWAGLSFTPEGLPKVILFIAVTGTMLMVLLSIITAAIAGFMGTAHAQTAFSPVDPTQDLAQNWMNYIFFGQPLSNYYAQNGAQIPSGIGIQCSLMSALGFYSNSMLIFAGIILLYHLASMVVSTAHEGKVMGGKANQVWAPIRLVVAVGLLVPVGGGPSSCSQAGGAGLSSGQYIVIQIAEWGSGMASQAWNVFLQSLSAMSYTVIPPNPPSVYGVASDITMMEACRTDWNYHVCVEDQQALGGMTDPTACDNPNSYTPTSSTPLANSIIQWTKTDGPNGQETYTYGTIAEPTKVICGSFILPGGAASVNPVVGWTTAPPDPAVTAMQAIYNAHRTAVNQLLSAVSAVGALVIQFEKPAAGLDPTTDMSSNSLFSDLASGYQNILNNTLSSATTSSVTTISQQDAANMAAWGWPGAATFLNTIARNQGVVVNAYEDGLPKTTPPKLDDVAAAASSGRGPMVADMLSAFADWMKYGGPGNTASVSAAATNGPSSPCAMQQTAAVGSTGALSPADSLPTPPEPKLVTKSDDVIAAVSGVKDEIELYLSRLTGMGPNDKILDIVLAMVNRVAVYSGVWSKDTPCSGANGNAFNLGTQLVTANPLAELSFWGYANLRTSYDLWDLVFKWSIYAVEARTSYQMKLYGNRGATTYHDIMTESLRQTYVEFIASAFGFISLIFFACGFWAFIVPLMPYFRFFFNVVTWLASLLEAVVAIPLVALVPPWPKTTRWVDNGSAGFVAILGSSRRLPDPNVWTGGVLQGETSQRGT